MQISPEQLQPKTSKLLLCATWLLMATMANVAFAQPAVEAPAPDAATKETFRQKADRVFAVNTSAFLRRAKVDDEKLILEQLQIYDSKTIGDDGDNALAGRYFGATQDATLKGLTLQWEEMETENIRNSREARQQLLQNVGAVGDTPEAVRKRAALVFLVSSPLPALQWAMLYMEPDKTYDFSRTTRGVNNDGIHYTGDLPVAEWMWRRDPTYQVLRTRVYVRNRLDKALRKQGFGEPIIQAALGAEEALSAQYERQKLASTELLETLLDESASPVLLATRLSRYEEVERDSAAEIERILDALNQKVKFRDDPRLLLVLRENDLVPTYGFINDMFEASYWAGARQKALGK